MKNIQFIIKAILLEIISMTLAVNVLGQTEEILVGGNPPLTKNNSIEIIRYYERGLII